MRLARSAVSNYADRAIAAGLNWPLPEGLTETALPRQRIDKRLSALKPEDRFSPPPKGWIWAIRDTLGMTGVQLAARLKVPPQTLEALEKSEAAGSIQLSTLRRAAEALDCTLVYAPVPNSSLDGAVKARAQDRGARAEARHPHHEAGSAGDRRFRKG